MQATKEKQRATEAGGVAKPALTRPSRTVSERRALIVGHAKAQHARHARYHRKCAEADRITRDRALRRKVAERERERRRAERRVWREEQGIDTEDDEEEVGDDEWEDAFNEVEMKSRTFEHVRA